MLGGTAWAQAHTRNQYSSEAHTVEAMKGNSDKEDNHNIATGKSKEDT